jgi:hypothetical protein
MPNETEGQNSKRIRIDVNLLEISSQQEHEHFSQAEGDEHHADRTSTGNMPEEERQPRTSGSTRDQKFKEDGVGCEESAISGLQDHNQYHDGPRKEGRHPHADRSDTEIRKERSKRKKTLGANMAWWNKWWNRMEEEALSTKLMEKQRTIPTFMSISTKDRGGRYSPLEKFGKTN